MTLRTRVRNEVQDWLDGQPCRQLCSALCNQRSAASVDPARKVGKISPAAGFFSAATSPGCIRRGVLLVARTELPVQDTLPVDSPTRAQKTFEISEQLWTAQKRSRAANKNRKVIDKVRSNNYERKS